MTDLRLHEALLDMCANGTVRSLLASVAQDAQSESVDVDKSWSSVVFDASNDDHKQALFLMRRTLTRIWLLGIDVTGAPVDERFWYENHTRVLKLLVCLRVCEHCNLASFGCTPEKGDIPTPIVSVALFLSRYHKEFLENAHKKWHAKLETASDCAYLSGPEFKE